MDLDKKTYLLLGDSRAYSLPNGLKDSFPNSNIFLVAAWTCNASIDHDSYREHLGGLASVVSWAKPHGSPVVLFGPVAE